MKVVVTATGTTLDSPVSPVFGRCPAYVFVDTETMEYEGVANPAAGAAGGAGIQAAQFIVQKGAQAVISGNVGPNAFSVLSSAGVAIYLAGQAKTVREAVELLKKGELAKTGDANVGGHFGTRGGGMGMGRGGGRGMRRNW
ncbi:MAG: NifB/NifX family molybdenum-iron cluster-binding protein [Anaerolineae bacterium]|nr:NifB/NifX family molybdenum-iron cluster-binding protein [Anaerolineae bacterium]